MASRHLVFVGLSGAGKSTVGRMLADRLELPFVDLDRRLEAEAGMPVSDMFSVYGEPEFRRREAQLLDAVLKDRQSVIATGGGTVVSASNRELIRRYGRIIWLIVSPKIAAARVKRSEDRPLLADNAEETLKRLLELREIAYADCDVSLDTDVLSPEEIIEELVRWVELGVAV